MISQQSSNIGALKILFTQFYENREKNNTKRTSLPPQERATNGFTIWKIELQHIYTTHTKKP